MSQCYAALWDGRPVAFCAVIGMYGFKGRRRIHRIVTLPDYQGIGVGGRLIERVCHAELQQGHRINITTSHPAMIGYCKHSTLWRTVNVSKTGRQGKQTKNGKAIKNSQGRSVVSFEFIGE